MNSATGRNTRGTTTPDGHPTGLNVRHPTMCLGEVGSSLGCWRPSAQRLQRPTAWRTHFAHVPLC
eukprot:4240029-Alexandrium_andersonii.AAC.1